MEIKPMRKIASVSLAAWLMLGGNLGGEMFGVAWAQNEQSPESSQSVTPSASPAPESTTSPIRSIDQTAQEASAQSSVPIWLLAILGILGLWNAALTFIFWQHFNKSIITKNHMDQKIRKSEKIDHDLNQRITRKFDELRSQISSFQSTLDSIKLQVQQSRTAKSDEYRFEAKPQQVSYGSNEPLARQDYDYPSRQESHLQPSPTISNPWDSIVQNYNLSPQALEQHIIERVSESTESLDSRRGNSNAAVFLKTANNYSYWIFAGEDRNYWLTPKSDLKITPMGFDTLQALFECPEYQSGSKIQIVKPAKVSQNNLSGGWDLMEKGQVIFIR